MKIYAMNAIDNAYAPYSDFKVGACVELTDGQYITGSNVVKMHHTDFQIAQNEAPYLQHIPEAIGKKISKPWQLLPMQEKLTMPCGACRQVLSELLLPDTSILIANDKEERSSPCVNSCHTASVKTT